MKSSHVICALALGGVTLMPAEAGDPGELGQFADLAGNAYRVHADLTYAVASSTELKLDVYQPSGAPAVKPVVVYFHGGGWVEGRRQAASLLLLPFLAQGWAVVNADYRLARVAPAPAAAVDARCVLHWVHRMAERYGFDRDAIVLAGDSAGGHLALLAAMLPSGSAFDHACPAPDEMRWNGRPRPEPRVAAVVNWFGVTDVAALLEGPEQRNFAVEWFGEQPHRLALATQVSPLTWVRKNSPPVITVHGDSDPVVPYRHALALHRALDQSGVRHKLLTVPGGRHGEFGDAHVVRAQADIRRFLQDSGIKARTFSAK
jgi:acetyl esterase/lipase